MRNVFGRPTWHYAKAGTRTNHTYACASKWRYFRRKISCDTNPFMDALPANRSWQPSCSNGTYQHETITSRSRQLLMMGTWLTETCWATIRREIKNTKETSSWFFLSTQNKFCLPHFAVFLPICVKCGTYISNSDGLRGQLSSGNASPEFLFLPVAVAAESNRSLR